MTDENKTNDETRPPLVIIVADGVTLGTAREWAQYCADLSAAQPDSFRGNPSAEQPGWLTPCTCYTCASISKLGEAVKPIQDAIEKASEKMLGGTTATVTIGAGGFGNGGPGGKARSPTYEKPKPNLTETKAGFAGAQAPAERWYQVEAPGEPDYYGRFLAADHADAAARARQSVSARKSVSYAGPLDVRECSEDGTGVSEVVKHFQSVSDSDTHARWAVVMRYLPRFFVSDTPIWAHWLARDAGGTWAFFAARPVLAHDGGMWAVDPEKPIPRPGRQAYSVPLNSCEGSPITEGMFLVRIPVS